MEYKQLKQKQVSKEMEAKITSNINQKLMGIDNILKKASLAGAFIAEAIQDQTSHPEESKALPITAKIDEYNY
jgi:hypothetical protein